MSHDAILRKVYKRAPSWLLQKYDLINIEPTSSWASNPFAACNIAFAVNDDVGDTPVSDSLVVGGPCIGYSLGRPDRVRIDIIVDTIIPLYIAAWAKCDCLLYLHIEEESRIGSSDLSAYSQIAGVIQQLALAVSSQLDGIGTLHVLRTDDIRTSAILDTAERKYSKCLSDDEMRTLYSIDSSGRKVQHNPSRNRLHRRAVLSYLPSVLNQFSGLSFRRIVAAETFHQIKAIQAARRIIYNHEINSTIDHLTFIPPPSLTATNRMCRSRLSSCVTVYSDSAGYKRAIREAHAVSKKYWNDISQIIDMPKLIHMFKAGLEDSSLQ